LRAKADLEREKQPSLRFTSAKISEQQAIFTLTDAPRDEVLGHPSSVFTKGLPLEWPADACARDIRWLRSR
jgi:hypothetical protein